MEELQEPTERVCDIMLAYSEADREFGMKLAEPLKKRFDVWYPDGQSKNNTPVSAPRAVVDSKVFIVVMTSHCVQEPEMRDQVALAYISNSIIIPVGREYYPDVSKHMDSAMLLTLAKINWIFFVKLDEYEQKLERFLQEVTQALAEYEQCHRNGTRSRLMSICCVGGGCQGQQQDESLSAAAFRSLVNSSCYKYLLYTSVNACLPTACQPSGGRNQLSDIAIDSSDFQADIDKFQYNFNRQCSVKRSESKDFGACQSPLAISANKPMNHDFWERNWGSKQDDVTWEEFSSTFFRDYNSIIEESFGKEGADRLMKLMKTDIFDMKDSISRSTYDAFCGKQESDNESMADHFFSCLCDYTVGYFAIREVFNMESSVRLQAIQNIGKFQTPSVICSLADLTMDNDPNIRAVAALGLGRAGKTTKRVLDSLVRLLSDDDRLVRQSACLAQALLKEDRAVNKISDMWRNDPISQVRESAQIAINHIGGPEAEKALKINSMLSGEMKNLRAGNK